MIVLGALLIFQGFGGALAPVLWGGNLGLTHLIDLPMWSRYAIGVIGVACVLAGLNKRKTAS
ncbi:hypothetical protein N8J89_26200 [Crossiella sp. CA-258035]|uniref:hypothetical protein n=1 Tax=Crossiella sp. CA-258035 TaxID=2981138 RepID=UPI0024BD3519|nr:hypothetical protein [Crossiella sp. CA-258035]WHT16619.1 hypothetical protein N8J89_26200 [Crossiella sp. CA-258035]